MAPVAAQSQRNVPELVSATTVFDRLLADELVGFARFDFAYSIAKTTTTEDWQRAKDCCYSSQ
jgi:hypothetical protein